MFPGVPLTGRLVDAATRQPFGRASINLSHLQYMDTSEDGRFTFSNVPPGEHLLGVYRKGTERTRQLVKLLPGQANDVGDIAVP